MRVAFIRHGQSTWQYRYSPVETWPIQEFTYLQPSRWNGTQSEKRMPHIVRYWQEADTRRSTMEKGLRASTTCSDAIRRPWSA